MAGAKEWVGCVCDVESGYLDWSLPDVAEARGSWSARAAGHRDCDPARRDGLGRSGTELGQAGLFRRGLEHTALTWMAAAGVELHILQRVAGHRERCRGEGLCDVLPVSLGAE
jgi:hypothetical protein